MVNQNIKKVEKSSHLTQEGNQWGTHDDISFTSEQVIPVRCPKCNNLMDSEFFAEAECPNCHWTFSKAQARDMYVESIQVKAVHGGWSEAMLDNLSSWDESCVVGPDMDARPIDDVARKVVSFYIAELRKEEARRKIISDLRATAPNWGL